ncbi:MAG: hypothetical protein AAE987_03600 [Thermoplasmataceae archaeon]|jgi:hypothetical protein
MNNMEKFQKYSVFAILGLSFLGLAVIFYFEFRFYLSIPVIHPDDFYPFYAETVIASLPVITASLFLFRKYKNVIERRPQKFIRLSFGVLWIVDAILQVQPEMNNLFAQYTLYPILQMGTVPAFFAKFAIKFWDTNPPMIDLAAAMVQLYVGALTLAVKNGRLFVAVQAIAIIWSVGIWFFGEGLGGVLSVGSTFLTGLPGSVLFYAIASILLIILLYRSENSAHKIIKFSMIIVFIISFIEQVLPLNNFWHNIPLQIYPSPDNFLNFAVVVQTFIYNRSFLFNLIFSVILILITLTWVFSDRIGPIFTFFFAMFSWVVYQGLGIFGPFSTDSNSGLIVAILCVSDILMLKNGFGGHKSSIKVMDRQTDPGS